MGHSLVSELQDGRPGVLDYGSVDRKRREQECGPSRCRTLDPPARHADKDVHNSQVVLLIAAVGKHYLGSRAVFRAIAERRGNASDSDIGRLACGRAADGKRLRVRSHLRDAL